METYTAQVLPLAAARMLQQAAQTPIPPSDPRARVKAIEKAIDKVKALHPHHFKTDEGVTP